MRDLSSKMKLNAIIRLCRELFWVCNKSINKLITLQLRWRCSGWMTRVVFLRTTTISRYPLCSQWWWMRTRLEMRQTTTKALTTTLASVTLVISSLMEVITRATSLKTSRRPFYLLNNMMLCWLTNRRSSRSGTTQWWGMTPCRATNWSGSPDRGSRAALSTNGPRCECRDDLFDFCWLQDAV